jgi:hypothetical protein
MARALAKFDDAEAAVEWAYAESSRQSVEAVA